jgi:hypothetical protein
LRFFAPFAPFRTLVFVDLLGFWPIGSRPISHLFSTSLPHSFYYSLTSGIFNPLTRVHDGSEELDLLLQHLPAASERELRAQLQITLTTNANHGALNNLHDVFSVHIYVAVQAGRDK